MENEEDIKYLLNILEITEKEIQSLKEIKQFKSFEDWMRKTFDDQELSDIANNGADKGWNMLTYYNETFVLYSRFHKEIWEMLVSDAEVAGYKTPLEFINTFNGAGIVSDDQFKNLLVWYAAERVASSLSQS